ncbi:MAG: cytochrome-c peroxidase [Chitinophagaceae bacterium]|nr:cytochrome-c peroxidase [Chitinophagaceae bacterium]
MIKKTVLLLIICGAIISLQYMRVTASANADVKSYYLKQIETLKTAIESFKTGVDQKQSNQDLQKQFSICRISYKKLAVLTDYFNQYETRLLNSPAISRIESEVVDRIIPPSGFQAIEDILFNDWDENNYNKIDSLLNDIIQILRRLEKEPDMEYKFKDELVWDALRSAIVGITTSGITGLDSPTANYSLPEANASIDGILQILNFYKSAISEKNPNAFTELTSLLINAKGYLLQNKNFNKFDRLAFITSYINPIYKKLIETRKETGIAITAGRQAVNADATSFFSTDALNINFYSPPEEYWVTPERVELGKRLFSDPILSGNNTRSCATCHQPAKAFTDGLQKPFALDNKTLLTRNTPTLYNSGYQTTQFYDSRSDILENQLTEVVHNQEEMKGSLKQSVVDLKKSIAYSRLFNAAYPAEKDPLNTYTIANAIASYVRSLQSLNSRFDEYVRGDETKLTKAEKKGFNLFAGKAKCATCHFIPLFNGVVPPFYANTESEVIGVPKTKSKNPAELDDDLGKYLFIQSDIYKHSFKTPTLRNIELTAPYMHNGVFDTLEEVMEFYNNGGGKGLHIAPKYQTLPFDKLNLSKEIKILFLL